MKKRFLPLLFISMNTLAQVGINTETPSSTLDVTVKRNNLGVIENNSKHFGIQAPRVSRLELTNTTANYDSNQTGAIVYITDISAGTAIGSRANITSIGYYYFDGNNWQKILNKNLYNADGVLTENRFLDFNNNSLTFGEATKGQSINFSHIGGITINKPTTGTRSSLGLTSGSASLRLFSDESGLALIAASGSNTGVAIGTRNTSDSAPITFLTSSGSNANGTERMRITGSGNVGIATINPTEKLQVSNGTVRFASLPINGATNAINTTSSGSQSATQNQTFNATRTLVADNNGVVGYVLDLPRTLNITRVTLPTIAATLPANSNSTVYTNIYVDIPPGTFKLDISLGLTLSTVSTYTEGSNFVRLRVADSETPVSVNTFSSDALYPRYASQGFPFSQSQGVVTGSLVVKNSTSANKRYYIHIDNGASYVQYRQVVVNNGWNESSLVYYPVTSN